MSVNDNIDRITFSLPHDLNVALDNLKKAKHRSKSELINQALEEFLQKEEQRRLEEAVAVMAREYSEDKKLTALTALDGEDFL
ncbi:ribbon-helix-helix domain-containing protein [Nitratifractor sp.]|uniref:ribbon-helix-helix domain-containing protein n=1 Tax=Nitratifractor sp. TaxID=2268144 RepID=UPI0025EDDC65|nr:ribbon-helix-helix domain-containing protein [Nitratifractor sp.]